MAKAKGTKKAKATKKQGDGAARKESPIEKTARAAAIDQEAALASLLGEIREHVREIGARFYDVGVALMEIVDRKLYAVRRHRSLGALVTAEKLMSPRQAAKLVAVARKVKREDAVALGLEKTYALMGYAAATPAADSVAGLLEGGTIEGRPVRRLSLRQIDAAAKAARTAASARPATARSKADAKVARALATAMRAGGAPKGTITVGPRRVRIDLPRDVVERWMATL